MPVWICSIAKMEELYIREWIEHYKSLGVDHIVLGDNNDSDYIKPLSLVIKDFIEEGFVELINVNDKKFFQLKFYDYVYQTYSDKFKWISFLDTDVFLELPKYKEIHNFVNAFKEFDSVILNWLVFSDNEKLYYEDKPLKERFTKPLFYHPLNNMVNYFVKNNLGKINYIHCPPTDNIVDIYGNSNYKKYLNINGVYVDRKTDTTKDIKNAFLKHYITKSTEEYINYKRKRGTALTDGREIYNKKFYFFINKPTREKLEMFEKFKII